MDILNGKDAQNHTEFKLLGLVWLRTGNPEKRESNQQGCQRDHNFKIMVDHVPVLSEDSGLAGQA